MSKIINRIKENAENLAILRSQIAAVEEATRLQLEKLKVERDALQEALVDDLKKEGLASIKTSAGESYTLSKRRGVNIVNDMLAMKWAVENNAISIDRRIVAARLAKVDELPKGFELVTTEFISVRGAKSKED